MDFIKNMLEGTATAIIVTFAIILNICAVLFVPVVFVAALMIIF